MLRYASLSQVPAALRRRASAGAEANGRSVALLRRRSAAGSLVWEAAASTGLLARSCGWPLVPRYQLGGRS